MNKIDLNQRTAIVTGGAKGIGYAITERLIKSGANVMVWDIDSDRLNETEGLLRTHGKILVETVDVTDLAAISSASKKSLEILGKIDILINITNDSWFGNKIGPYQHFYISRIKAIVANKPLLRVSNNGISAIIDNNGKIIKSSKLNKISQLKHKLKINNNRSYFFMHKIFMFYLFSIFIFLKICSKRKEIWK